MIYNYVIDILTKDMGIPIKQSKTVLSCTLLTFLSIELDSTVMEKRLHQDKLRKTLHLIQTYKARKTVTLQELQSIIGVLNFLVLRLFRDVHFLGDSMTLQ